MSTKVFNANNPVAQVAVPWEEDGNIILHAEIKSTRHKDVEPIINQEANRNYALQKKSNKNTDHVSAAKKSEEKILKAVLQKFNVTSGGEDIVINDAGLSWEQVEQFFPSLPTQVMREAERDENFLVDLQSLIGQQG